MLRISAKLRTVVACRLRYHYVLTSLGPAWHKRGGWAAQLCVDIHSIYRLSGLGCYGHASSKHHHCVGMQRPLCTAATAKPVCRIVLPLLQHRTGRLSCPHNLVYALSRQTAQTGIWLVHSGLSIIYDSDRSHIPTTPIHFQWYTLHHVWLCNYCSVDTSTPNSALSTKRHEI